MTRSVRCALSVCVLFVSLVALPLRPASPISSEPRSEDSSRLQANVTVSDDTRSLQTGDELLLGRGDGGRLVVSDADHPRVRFVEVNRKEVVLRVTPLDAEGTELGSGRLIVLGGSERRDVSMRDELVADAVAASVTLRVEVLEGNGRILVFPLSENGSALQILPESVSHRRRAVRLVPRPTSFALIDAAEGSGVLSHDTAVLYRVYSLFEDARLPAEYRGNDANAENSFYLAEVREQIAALSPAVQAALQPFLTPPAYTTSWANNSSGAVVSETPPPCQFFSDKWGSVDSSNSLVRVWYRVDNADDQRNARSLVGQIDTKIWPSLSGLMKTHLPISDLNESCNGGNGRLDIYLVDAKRSLTVPANNSCKQVPVFILLKRISGNALSVHEIFHAIQYSLPLRSCVTSPDYRWWAEATAEWSQDYVYPSDQGEHASAPELLGSPEEPLDLINDKHEYGAYLLPFYVYKKTGNADFVRTAWERCATTDAIHALDQTLTGGFEAVWPAFVLDNWNQKPVDDYTTWDSMKAGAAVTETAVNLAGGPDGAAEIPYKLPRLSATYRHYKFTDPSARFIVFWNGANYKLTLQDNEGSGIQYFAEDAPSDKTKGARVQALMKMHGQDQWQSADWTSRPVVSFCRDLLAERIDELVLVISNSDLTADRKLEPPSLAPVVWASNMGCWQWKGTATETDPRFGASISTTVTWTRDDAFRGLPFISYIADGTEQWRYSIPGCSGSGTLPIQSQLAVLWTYNFNPPQGTYNRVYWIEGGEDRVVNPLCAAVGSWAQAPPTDPVFPGFRLLKVSANGTVMDGSFSFSGSPETWTWHLVAQMQP